MAKKIIGILICWTSILCIFLSGCSPDGISGDEWLMKQDVYMEDLQAFADGMDEVYSLYISGAISADDFSNELSVLKDQFAIIQAAYEQAKRENPILPEDYSYAAQRGVAGVENIRRILGEILDNSLDQDGTPLSPAQLLYMYLASGQELSNYLADYLTAYQIIASETTTTETEGTE